jgi:CheY-like chemotaxis protein
LGNPLFAPDRSISSWTGKSEMLENGKSIRVLIADDERMIANTLARILTSSGFEASAVYSGENAIEAARDLKPDVLITDVIMGGMTGIEAAIHIVGLLPNCRIILFSGQASTADLLECASAKGHRFEILSKPIHPRVLLDHLSAPV